MKKTGKTATLLLAGSLLASSVTMQTQCGMWQRFFNSKYGAISLAYFTLIGGTFAKFYFKDKGIKTAKTPFYLKNIGHFVLNVTKGSAAWILPATSLLVGKKMTKKYIKPFINLEFLFGKKEKQEQTQEQEE
ncbi:hypothetical protein ACFLYA_01595 [Candidatus Dependentiae bacterium]